MKQTLIIACGTLESGGAERMISVLSAFFLQRFDRVEIYTWRDAPVFYQLDERIPVVSVLQQSGQKSLPGQMLWFRKQMKATKPFCVLSFLAPFNMLTLVSLLGTSVPVFIANRSDPLYDAPNRMWRWIRDMIYRFATGVCVQTERNKQYFSKAIRQKTTVIYNPVFIEQEMYGKALSTLKQKVIVSVGRLSKEKNQILLLEACAAVFQIQPDYRLIIYGEGDYRPVLENKVRELGLQDKVCLPGSKKNVLQLIPEAEMFVMCSDYEGMSNALIEAMCLGLPCVSTRVSGAEELIEDGVNGYLVEVGDKDGLIRVINGLIQDREKANQIGREGIKLTKKLGMDVIVDQWMRFLRDEK